MARPWETLDTAHTPDGKLELRRRGERDFLLTIGGRVLMTSVGHRSEDALAKLACADVVTQPGARVLIGGLGMGFTLRAALDVLRPDARVTVVELNEVVVRWCRQHLAGLTDHAVDEPRTALVHWDVSQVLAQLGSRSEAGGLDVVMIDLYEGPQTRLSPRHPLYGVQAARNVFSALAPGGTYAVWCEQRSLAFEGFLRAAGFVVSTEKAGYGERVHRIYVAKRPTSRAARAPRPKPAPESNRRPAPPLPLPPLGDDASSAQAESNAPTASSRFSA
jgi:spermidine synthase